MLGPRSWSLSTMCPLWPRRRTLSGMCPPSVSLVSAVAAPPNLARHEPAMCPPGPRLNLWWFCMLQALLVFSMTSVFCLWKGQVHVQFRAWRLFGVYAGVSFFGHSIHLTVTRSLVRGTELDLGGALCHTFSEALWVYDVCLEHLQCHILVADRSTSSSIELKNTANARAQVASLNCDSLSLLGWFVHHKIAE